MTRPSEKYWALLAVGLFCIGCIYIGVCKPVHDFANYYFGGEFLGNGRFSANIYFPQWFNWQIVADGHAPAFAGFAPNTPFLALLFYPISLLPIATAKVVFNLISAALLLFSLKRLADFYRIAPRYLFLIPIVFAIPLRNEILFGQVYLLLFFFLAESWLAYEKKQSAKTAIFLSLAIMLKVFPVLLLVFFTFRKDFKIVAYAVAGCFLLTLATLPFCAIDTWQFYLTDVLAKASNGEIASGFEPNYQSPFMFLRQWLVYDAVENPGGWFTSPAIFSAVIFAFKIKVLAIGWQLIRKVQSQLHAFSYWIFACILISPYGSTYTFVLMLFPYFAIAKSQIGKWQKVAMLALIFLLSNFPLSVFIDLAYPMSYLRFFVLIAFFALLVSTLWRLVNWKIVAACSLVGFGLKLTMPIPESPGKLLLHASPLLVYDYEIKNQKLTYSYWDGKGGHRASMPFESASVMPADLIRNQVYFHGKKLVYDKSHKRKPMIIDGKTLIYLTDAGRGIGFYTLRKIEFR